MDSLRQVHELGMSISEILMAFAHPTTGSELVPQMHALCTDGRLICALNDKYELVRGLCPPRYTQSGAMPVSCTAQNANTMNKYNACSACASCTSEAPLPTTSMTACCAQRCFGSHVTRMHVPPCPRVSSPGNVSDAHQQPVRFPPPTAAAAAPPLCCPSRTHCPTCLSAWVQQQESNHILPSRTRSTSCSAATRMRRSHMAGTLALAHPLHPNPPTVP